MYIPYEFHTIFSLTIGLLGMFFGSFANVVVYRLKHGGSISKGRSACPHCKHHLGILDLFPVLSWIFLRARCRYCSSPISAKYPITELTFGGFWYIFTWNMFPIYGLFEWTEFLLVLFIVSALITLSVYDILYYEIPDEISLPAIVASAGLISFQSWQSFLSPIVACIIIYSFFYIQIFIPGTLFALKVKKYFIIQELALSYFIFPFYILCSIILPQKTLHSLPLFESKITEDIPAWIGDGDLRLAFIMGLFLGITKGIVALFLAYIIGSFVGIILLKIRKKTSHTMIPFGPFLSIGTLIAYLYGTELWTWYTHLTF